MAEMWPRWKSSARSLITILDTMMIPPGLTPWMARPAMSMPPVEVPPEMPSSSTKMAATVRIMYSQPKSLQSWPKGLHRRANTVAQSSTVVYYKEGHGPWLVIMRDVPAKKEDIDNPDEIVAEL
jgi:hypothetical protein